jgi:hypothetical protein
LWDRPPGRGADAGCTPVLFEVVEGLRLPESATQTLNARRQGPDPEVPGPGWFGRQDREIGGRAKAEASVVGRVAQQPASGTSRTSAAPISACTRPDPMPTSWCRGSTLTGPRPTTAVLPTFAVVQTAWPTMSVSINHHPGQRRHPGVASAQPVQQPDLDRLPRTSRPVRGSRRRPGLRLDGRRLCRDSVSRLTSTGGP